MIKSEAVDKLPEKYKKDIEKAVEILKNRGCTEVYLFGSLALGDYHEKSDIDLGIKGLEKRVYFKTWAEIDREINNEIDLVDFDGEDNRFAQFMMQIGECVRIG